ncbi:hypothetical protein AAFN60_02080 [Roseibacillus persicicus]|uniref:hypothetical protein n=1 Tax=Roseibacillus persicicus TaxID=454148 RepID=UPI00398B08AC
MLKSPYKVTFDPGGGDELVLLAYDETLLASPFPERTDEGDDFDFAEAADTLPVARGGAKRVMTLALRRRYDDPADLVAAHVALDSGLPNATSSLRLEVASSSGVTGATYNATTAHIRSYSFVQSVDKVGQFALITYKIHLTPLTLSP